MDNETLKTESTSKMRHKYTRSFKKPNGRVRKSFIEFIKEYIYLFRSLPKQTKKFVIITTSAFIAIITTLIVVLVIVFSMRTDYKIINTTTIEDRAFSGCDHIGSSVLYYTSNEAFLVSPDGENIWKQSYEMSKPTLQKGNICSAIMDVSGNQIIIFREDKVLGTYKTQGVILTGKIADNGIAAIIEKSGGMVKADMYDYKGKLLVENKTGGDIYSYPMGMNISPEGKQMLISYLSINATNTSIFNLYDFSNPQDEEKLKYQKKFKNTSILDIFFITDNRYVLVADNQLIFYENVFKPKIVKKILLKNEIKSVLAYDEKLILITSQENKNYSYKLQIFNDVGKEKDKTFVNRSYSKISVNDDGIILFNEFGATIYSMGCRKIFDGNFDDNIQEIVPSPGFNKYLLVTTGNDIQEVKLK